MSTLIVQMLENKIYSHHFIGTPGSNENTRKKDFNLKIFKTEIIDKWMLYLYLSNGNIACNVFTKKGTAKGRKKKQIIRSSQKSGEPIESDVKYTHYNGSDILRL